MFIKIASVLCALAEVPAPGHVDDYERLCLRTAVLLQRVQDPLEFEAQLDSWGILHRHHLAFQDVRGLPALVLM